MSIVANTEGFFERHPYASAGIAIGTVFVLYILLRGSSSTGVTTSGTSSTDAATAAAAQLAAAQIGANATTTQDSIAASVTNAQTAAAQEVADTASNNATQLSIAQANDATTLGVAQVQGATAVSGNSAIASEFTSLATALQAFGTQQNIVQTSSAGTQGADIASVLNTASNNNTSIVNNFENDFYGAVNNGIDNNGSYVVPFFLTGGSAGTNASGFTSNAGGVVSPNPTGGTAAGLSASDLANLFQGASSSTTVTTALTGDQFSQNLSGLTAALGNGINFHA